VVDTGIRWDHDEFYEAPAECGFDSVNAASEAAPVDDTEIRESACFDGVGHGTYVAGIIGGDAYVRTGSRNLLCKASRQISNISLNQLFGALMVGLRNRVSPKKQSWLASRSLTTME
jgi:hypothetical protein